MSPSYSLLSGPGALLGCGDERRVRLDDLPRAERVTGEGAADAVGVGYLKRPPLKRDPDKVIVTDKTCQDKALLVMAVRAVGSRARCA